MNKFICIHKGSYLRKSQINEVFIRYIGEDIKQKSLFRVFLKMRDGSEHYFAPAYKEEAERQQTEIMQILEAD